MNLEKLKILDQIRLALFRHRGNVAKVSEELNVPSAMVYRAAAKLKKELKLNNSGYWIAEGLFQELILGRNQRVAECTKDLDNLSNDSLISMSLCCDARVSVFADNGKVMHTCSKCKSICETYVKSDPESIAEKAKLIEILRAEDESLIKFADRFGLVPNANEEKRGSKTIESTVRSNSLDDETLKKIQQMTPMQRERLRNKTERALQQSLSQPALEGEVDGPERPIATEEGNNYKTSERRDITPV
jgi:hypothetical protein